MGCSVITVSGTPLSGKTTVARKLCAELGFEYVSPTAFYSRNGRLQKGKVVVDHIYAATACCRDNIDAFHVFLEAPAGIRARRLMERDRMGGDIGAVEEFLLEKEEKEFEIGKSMYKCDYRYPCFYNVSRDTGKLDVGKEMALILRAYNLRCRPARAAAEVY